MTSNQQATAGTFTQFEGPTLATGPILVASDATESSEAALVMAKVLAAHSNAPVSVVSVLKPFSAAPSAYALVPAALEYDNQLRVERERAVKAQLQRIAPTWSLELRDGDSAFEIAKHANALGARLIVTGRGRHSVLERMFGGDTVLRLLQTGDSPVLAVKQGLTHLPRRVVIAVDFSEYSLFAARVALSFAASDAEVFLVHVGPLYEEAEGLMKERAGAVNKEAVEHLSQMRARLDTHNMTVHEVLLTGNPYEELIKYATDNHADLIATATHGYGFLRRALLGSVTTAMVHGAPCSVLCVPGSALAAAAALTQRMSGAHTRRLDLRALDAELSAFTERNIGRRCTVQVNRNDIGAQVLGHHLPLVGATFEKRGNTVSLMFGASELEGNHLSHVINGVTDIELSSDTNGTDAVMQCVHADGYTLITLE